MNKELNSSITAVRVPQQSDGVDCGMYLLIFTDLIIQRIMQENHFLLSLQSPFPNIERSALILKCAQLAMLYFNSAFHQQAKTITEMIIETQNLSAEEQPKGKYTLLPHPSCKETQNYEHQWKTQHFTRNQKHTMETANQRESVVTTKKRFTILLNQKIQEKTQEENFVPAIFIGKSKSDSQKKQICTNV